ncbi:hypothetical protein [Paeniglutamicibacter terrestris]|uniref:Uncharacterized protein n=1 Tax=Paeniglutamicibacter terrestris TaxID=2723403 RepID=A0ABX1G6B2_9MICC|nr:hypothetical protein [Paeniglutamicibacter terrestris]NKG21065.1 hypothetical protein [Paeniglutamicibacter terrestris]
MQKHDVGILALAADLVASPPAGLTHPDQPYEVKLLFDSVQSWVNAVTQYGAEVKYQDDDGDGQYAAVLKFGDIEKRPYAFAGAELVLVHVVDTE